MIGETAVFGFSTGVAATVTMDVLASASQRVGLTAGRKRFCKACMEEELAAEADDGGESDAD